ncbi:YpjP family protein [Bacillus sp. 2205SS5-2]|uniref:YpjP family protein n=1 Tax=Bacillus sp. 2205SS5-2 TaxID=3109031 RepID=UPI0030072FEF
MSNWIKKFFFVLISILTFGVITPSHTYINESHKYDNSDDKLKSAYDSSAEVENEIVTREEILSSLTKEGEKTAYDKFGSKIGPKIDREFQQVILPKIQQSISDVLNQYPGEDLSQLMVSEVPVKAKSEKLFHIYHSQTSEDIIRFHVRKDHPPLEGFYFNFHYHTYHDSFQAHHELGDIYWEKNTPPNWSTLS